MYCVGIQIKIEFHREKNNKLRRVVQIHVYPGITMDVKTII
jgi:hypothetical protein